MSADASWAARSAATDGVFILYVSGSAPGRPESTEIVQAVERDTGMCLAGCMITPVRGSGDLDEEYGRFLVETFERDGRLPPGSVGRAFVRDVTVRGVRRIVVVVLREAFHAWVRELVRQHVRGSAGAMPALAGRPGFARLIGEPALAFVASAWNDDLLRLEDVEIRVSLFAASDPARIRELIPGGDYRSWVGPWVGQVLGRGSDAAHWLVCADGGVGIVHLGYFAADRSTMFLPWDLLPRPDQHATRRVHAAVPDGAAWAAVDAAPEAAGEPEPPDTPEADEEEPPVAPAEPAPAAAVVEHWRVGDVVADLYDVRAVVTSGGMGLVHRVWHRGWQVELAVKTPRPELLGSPANVRSFEEEAEAWVGLGGHPNTVTCAYVRQMGGVPRVFAEWVDGGSLAEAVRDRVLYRGEERQVLGRLLDVAIQFARGLEHAHAKGLVHQDVKPGNVMLARDGTVKVTDFGLAKAYGEAPGGSPPGATVRVGFGGAMTREYCSPEQARAAHDPTVRLSRATDVWSWAISVWQLFVGEPPCRYGQAAPELFGAFLAERRVVAGLPPLPAAVATTLSRCFAADPAARPRMADLAAELTTSYATLTGERYPRPRPDPTTSVADGLCDHALSLLDVGRPERADRLWQQARAADPHHLYTIYNQGLRRWRRGHLTDAELVAELEGAGHGRPAGDHLLGLVHLERGDVAAARTHLERAARATPDDGEVAAALALAREQPDEPAPVVLAGHDDTVHGVAVSGDGRLAASGSADRSVRLWDLRAGGCRHVLMVDRAIDAIALGSAGARVVAHDVGGTLTVWDAGTGRRLHRVDTGPVRSLAISADGSTAVSASPVAVQVWNLDRGRPVRTLRPEHADLAGPRSVALTADGRLALAFYPGEGETRVWEVGSGRLVHVLDTAGSGTLDAESGMVISPREPARVPARTATVWTLDRIRTMHRPSIPTDRFAGAAALCTAGGRLVLGGDPRSPRSLAIWAFRADDRCLRTLAGHTDRITSVASSTDGRTLVSGGQDRTVRVWRPSPPGPVAPWRLSGAWLRR